MHERSEVKKYDAYLQFSLIAAQEAVANANINFNKLNKTRAGVIWGSANGGIRTFENEMFDFARGDGIPRISPFMIPKMTINMAPGLISMKYGLSGINYSTVSACASSNCAIISAMNYIRLGKADLFITGGGESGIVVGGMGGCGVAKALSVRNDNPCLASRPFDINRDGFVMGEGAAALVVESLEHAISRGANIIAELAGGAMAADAYHMTGSHPEGEGAYLSMMAALEDAGITANEIDYLCAHATSTPGGDISELKAIGRVFGNKKNLNISAAKSMIGHTLGASGAIESIAVIKAIEEDTIHPTINSKDIEPDYADKYDFTLANAVRKEVNYGMNNTFGFGGHAAVTIYKKYKG
jgi:3-oxoacyl-[acyl-carrier-protein] synthase II